MEGRKRTERVSFVGLDKKNNQVTEDNPCQASIPQKTLPPAKPFRCH
jgi:hypothetical protein